MEAKTFSDFLYQDAQDVIEEAETNLIVLFLKLGAMERHMLGKTSISSNLLKALLSDMYKNVDFYFENAIWEHEFLQPPKDMFETNNEHFHNN